MNVSHRSSIVIAIASMATLVGAVHAHDNGKRRNTFATQLIGWQEVPSVSTVARGFFWAKLDEKARLITFTLKYDPLEGAVQQAHIHVGQRHTNGGVSVFLCSNLGNAPAGTPACPVGPAEVTGTLADTSVIGPAAQGVAPGEFDELIRAIRSGSAYVNVHSDKFPAGEIRGQLHD